MSYFSLLFASKASGASPAVREIQNLKSDLCMEDGDFYSPSQWGESEQALPSGVASMEHWLDLNA